MKIRLRENLFTQKQNLKEGSKFSKQLFNLINDDQKLRDLFANEIENAGGWSQELVNKFVKKHGTDVDDVFGSKSVEEKFAKLFPKLDFSNFDDNDWENFSTLIIHQRKPEDSNIRRKSLSELIKAKREWKPLATDMARVIGILPELEGKTLSYPQDTEKGGRVDSLLKKKGITWENLANKLLRVSRNVR